MALGLTLSSSSHDWPWLILHSGEPVLGYAFDRIPAATKNGIGLCGYLVASNMALGLIENDWELLWIPGCSHYVSSKHLDGV